MLLILKVDVMYEMGFNMGVRSVGNIRIFEPLKYPIFEPTMLITNIDDNATSILQ